MSNLAAEQATDNDNHSTASALALDLIDGMPDVSEHAIAQHLEETAQLQERQNVTDKSGNRFDPAIHAVNDDGTPKYTATGMFAKKRGRKSGAESVLSAAKSDKTPQIDQSAVLRANKQVAAGTAAASLLITLGVVIGGDEWRPMKDDKLGIDEQAVLNSAFVDYFTANNLEDISPNMALGVVLASYILPRFAMPKTKARASTLWEKTKIWWANKRLKKHGLKAVADKTE